jgi:hypothetical protein
MAAISRLYKDYDTGARVVAELERSGIPHTDISIIANNDSGWFDRERSTQVDRDADGTDDRAEGAAKGAGIGVTLGGVAGLLPGLGMLAIRASALWSPQGGRRAPVRGRRRPWAFDLGDPDSG